MYRVVCGAQRQCDFEHRIWVDEARRCTETFCSLGSSGSVGYFDVHDMPISIPKELSADQHTTTYRCWRHRLYTALSNAL